MMMNKTIQKLVDLVLLGLVVTGCGKKEDVIKIGFAAPLTGDQAAIGQDLANGAQMAIDEVNAQGGLLGKKVVLVKMDDEHRPEVARNVATKLASDPKVIAVVGHLNSGATLPASEVYHDRGILMITPCATNPEITKRGYRNVFRACATDATQGEAGAEFAVNVLKKKRLGVVHDNTQYGKGLAEFFKQKATALGAAVVAFETISPIVEGGQDYSAVITNLKRVKPDLVYYGGMYPEAILFVKQMRGLGLHVQFMGGDGLFSESQYIPQTGAAGEGTILSFLTPPFEQAAPEFYKAFTAKYGRIEAYSPYSYDATRLVLDAIRRAGELNRQKVIEAMHAVKDFPGVMGTINFDEKGDRKETAVYFYQVKGGKYSWIH